MNVFDVSSWGLFKGRGNKVKHTQRGVYGGEYPLSDINFPINIFGAAESNTGVNVTASNALTIQAVYACIAKISTTIAALPFKIHERNGKYVETLVDHPVSVLIGRRPNDSQTPFDFWEDVISRACLYGEGVAYIERNSLNGIATGLKVLKNTEFTRVVDKDGNLFYRTNKYGVVSPMDLLIIPAFRHLSPISLHRETMGQSISQTNFASKFYKQGASVNGFFSTDHIFQDEATRKANESDIQSVTTGVDNAHKPPLLGAGMKWNAMSIPQKDAQYVETRKLTSHDICMIYGVPPFKVGLDSNTTFSNTEQQQLVYVQDTIIPWEKRIEDEVNLKLLPSSSTAVYSKIHDQALLRGDIKTRSEFYDKMTKIGVFNINECRGLEDMNPIEGGDVNLVQINQIPLSDIEAYGDKISKAESNE